MVDLPVAATTGGGEVAVVLLELGGLFVVLAMVGRVAGRLGLSPIPFYLLVGLPFGTGGLGPVFGGEFTEVGATIGVILLLFMLGLEFTAEELRNSLRNKRVGELLAPLRPVRLGVLRLLRPAERRRPDPLVLAIATAGPHAVRTCACVPAPGQPAR